MHPSPVWLVDDRRVFRDGRPAHVMRTLPEALRDLAAAAQDPSVTVRELWLDHDLGTGGVVMPVVTWLARQAFDGEPFRVGTVYVHTSNLYAQQDIVRALTTPRIAGAYDVRAVQASDHLIEDPALPVPDDL